MRKVFIILLVCLGMSMALRAQTYLNSTARWHQRYSWSGFSANTLCYSTFHITGDTLVNDTAYYKVFNTGFCVSGSLSYDTSGSAYWSYDTTQTSIFYTLLREQGRRFYKRQFSNPDELLYDFNLGAGGSVEQFTPYPSCGISPPGYQLYDTVCIGSLWRKRWQVSFSQYPLANWLIEGVGPSSGFLSAICRNGCPECSYNLLSFTLNGDTLYQGDCLLNLSANQPESRVAWQHTNEQVRCESPLQGLVMCVSPLGQILAQRLVEPGTEAVFSLAGMASGLYHFSLRGMDGRHLGQFRIFHR